MDTALDTLYRLLGAPDTGATVADARPSFVLDARTLLPVLANAAGLRTFGLADLATLAASALPLPEALAERLARFAAKAVPGQRRNDLVRYAEGEREVMERIEMTHLGDLTETPLILMTLASRAEPLRPEDAFGLAHLAGPDRFVVLFDDEGEAMTAHGDDTLLDEVHAEIEDLAASTDEALIQTRHLKTRDGDRAVALVALAGGPEQVLVITRLPRVSARSRLKVPPRRRPQDPTPELAPAADAPVAIAETSEVVAEAPVEAAAVPAAAEPEVATENAIAATDIIPGDDDAPAGEATDEAEAAAKLLPEDTAPVALATMNADAAATQAEAEAPNTEEEPALAETNAMAAPEPVADLPAQAEPRKFVWQMDGNRRFALVSPELEAIVGPEAAPRVGETWADLASRLTIDIDGKVAHALAGTDTWSGLTVLWPIAGEARRVPVDLAALPAFGRNRAFDGFRGFGTCRPGEALADVTATGLRLVPMAAIPPEVPVSTGDLPEFRLPDPEPQAAPAPVRPAEPRLIALPGTNGTPTGSRLTGPERSAFRQIAQALGVRIEGDDFMPEPEAAPEPPPRRVAPEAGETARVAEARLLDRLALPAIVAGDDRLLHVNPAFLDLFGYESLADLEAAGGLEALFAGRHALREAMRNPGEAPMPALTKTGKVLPVQARLATVPWGQATAVLVTLEPISPRADRPLDAKVPEPRAPEPKAADAAPDPDLLEMRERVAELETILDTATDGVLILDSDGAIVTANRAAEALFGVERAEVAGSPLTAILAPESRRSALDYLDGLSSNGVASVLNDGREVIGQVKPEGLIPLFMTVGRIGTGDRRKFCAVLRDITQWKKSEEELTAARRRAEEASLHKSDFLAKISHEIRTPLNAIIGFSEVMLDERFGTIGNERYRDYMRDIHSSGSHIMSLVNDLLDLSKVEAGKMDMKFEAVPLSELIGECVALMQPQANRERIIIRASLPANLPAVVADARSIRQIVLNLLSNAIKFTPAGGQVIVSAAMEDSGEVTVRVRDTGHGMTEKEIQTALEPFRQLHTTRTGVAGTGLGLPLTKALVEANRAAFQIASTPGQGTLVSMTFPVNRVLAG